MHVADALIARGHRTIVLDDLSGGFAENVNPAAEFRVGSCADVRVVNLLGGAMSIHCAEKR